MWPHAALWLGGHWLAITEVISVLSLNPSLVWTSSNPGWEFQAFRWGQEKPALLADSTSLCEFLGQGERQQPGLAHLRSSDKVGRSHQYPLLR